MNSDSARAQHCAVIGAGIVGAGVAHALAERGWRVTVFEQESSAARATSGLPVALAVPQISADDAPRSRLVRLGIEGLRLQAQRFLCEGQDWAPSGVLERRPNHQDRWHETALWIKPAALTHAWLAQAGITLKTQVTISQIQPQAGQWAMLDARGRTWGGFDAVVLANAMGCKELLRTVAWPGVIDPSWMAQMQLLHGVHGLMSHGRYPEPWPNLPAHPINGKGCFVPQVPIGEQSHWVLGSTFLTDPLQAADVGAQHQQNLERLHVLMPEGASDLVSALERSKAQTWSGTRCTTKDRFPLVGPVPGHHTQGLWMCTAMGSRAMSLVTICTQWLAEMLCASGSTGLLDASLTRHIHTERLRGKAKPFAEH